MKLRTHRHSALLYLCCVGLVFCSSESPMMGTMDTWMRQKFSFFTSSWSCLKASTKWPVLGQGQGRDDGRRGE